MVRNMDPNWKLDRRDSGRLFWRRDSALNTDNKTRVKFRYDVEVLEFLSADEDGHLQDDSSTSSSDEEVDVIAFRRRIPRGLKSRQSPSNAASASSSVLMCFLCVAAIVVTMSYQWLMVR